MTEQTEEVSALASSGISVLTMRWDETPKGGMATLAVLAAAAREAEELLSVEPDLDEPVIREANRRLKLFMRTARQLAR